MPRSTATSGTKKRTYTRKPAATYTKSRKRTYTKKKSATIRGPFRDYIARDPFPPSMFRKVTYSANVVLGTPATSLFGTQSVYNLNGLYDVDAGVGGHQPYGFDELMMLYEKYKVNGVLLNITINDPGADGVIVGMQVTPPSSSYSLTGKSLDEIDEQPMSIVRRVNNTGSQKVHVKQYFPMHRILGLTPLQFKADLSEYTGNAATNPGSIPLFKIAALNIAGTATAVSVTIKFTFYSQFYRRSVLPQS